MCHRWFLAVIMCMLPWQPVHPLPLEKASSEGFPGTTTTSHTTADFISSTVAPSNIQVQAPEGPLPPAFLSVQSMNDPQAFPSSFSHLVAFSKLPPPPIPTADSFAMDVDDSDRPHSRSKRRTPHDLFPACEYQSRWRKKSWAWDILGQNVTVVENITTSDKRVVGQWFFETTCANTREHSCRGIDHSRYVSRCISRSSWVFAVVRQANGAEGWNWVSIGTACNCGYKQRTSPLLEILEGRDSGSDETPT